VIVRDNNPETQAEPWNVTKPFRSPLFWIMMVAALGYLALFCFGYFKPLAGSDTDDYLRAADNISLAHLLSGDVDSLRTPVFPALICLARTLVGNDHAGQTVVIFQYFLYWLSILFFYRIVKNYPLSPFCTHGCVLVYALSPTLLAWNQMIYTESLSISSFVIVIALFSIYLCRPVYVTAILLGFSGFYLVMLRPSFLFFPLLMLVLWLPIMISRRVEFCKHLTGLGCTIVSLCFIFGYCHLVQKKCGVFSVSEVVVTNQYLILVQSGLYQKGKDTTIVDTIQSIIDHDKRDRPYLNPGNAWIYPTGLPDETFQRYFCAAQPSHMTLKDRSALVNQVIRDHRWQYLRYSLGKFIGVQHEVVGGRLSTRIVTFQLIYFLLSCEAITILLSRFRVNSLVLLYWSLIWMVVTGILVSTVLGAPHPHFLGGASEYSRLIMPVFPFVILLGFRYLDVLVQFWKKISKQDRVVTA